jgi:hypothetical protein
MSETVQRPAAKDGAAAGNSAASNKARRSAAVVAAVGVLLTLGAAGLAWKNAGIGIMSGDAVQPTIIFVAHSDIGAAATTLTPSAAGALVEDAERCKIPLVSLTIARGTASIGRTVRIRSGSYVSPYFTITEAMQRIAVPYPAPYGSGAGTFVVEGTATGAILGLAPGKILTELPAAQSIPVVWRTTSPC